MIISIGEAPLEVTKTTYIFQTKGGAPMKVETWDLEVNGILVVVEGKPLIGDASTTNESTIVSS